MLLGAHGGVAPLEEGCHLADQADLADHLEKPRDGAENSVHFHCGSQSLVGRGLACKCNRTFSVPDHTKFLAVSNPTHGVKCEEADPISQVNRASRSGFESANEVVDHFLDAGLVVGKS